MSDKGFLKYTGACFAYFFLVVAGYFYVNTASAWRQQWFSDKFFVFLYTTVFLAGSALIKGKFTPLTYCRYGTRGKAVFNQLLQHAILSVLLATLLFFPAIILTVVSGGATDFDMIPEMLNLYCRFMAGSYLIGCLDMILEYSGVKFFHVGSQVCVFLILTIELLTLVPKINQLTNIKIYLLFSWIFYMDMIAYAFLIGWSILLTIILFLVSRRGDLPV